MQEAMAVPVAIVLGLFMVSYLPWEAPCDPLAEACVTAAEWAGLVRFSGAWDEPRVAGALEAAGFEVQAGWGRGVLATDDPLRVRVFAEDADATEQTVAYLALERPLDIATPTEEGLVRAHLRAVLPETEARLVALVSHMERTLDWRQPDVDTAVWSVTIERLSDNDGLVEVRATRASGEDR